MAEWTKQEIEQEHLRRRRTPETIGYQTKQRCIHCGLPLTDHGSAREFGLCDDCLHRD